MRAFFCGCVAHTPSVCVCVCVCFFFFFCLPFFSPFLARSHKPLAGNNTSLIDRLVFLPSDVFHQRWQWLMALTMAYNFFIIPFRATFLYPHGNDSVGLLVIDVLVDLCWL